MKFNISKEWVMRQARLEEGQEIGAAALPDNAHPLHTLDWSLFPVKDMFKRNWFDTFSGSLAQAKVQATTLVRDYISRAIPRPVVALQRQRVRSGAAADRYALLAWQCRILLLARAHPPRGPYRASTLTESWFTGLVQLSAFDDGPVRAVRYLRNAGIGLVIEPHLPSTHLDGAALLGEHGPIVGLTLRHDRLDNFWFVLLHELIHVKKHLRKGTIEDILDDLDVAADDIEREADMLAGQALIPEEVWESALARFVKSEDAVRDLAAQLKISPAIVAGRIRQETEDYVIFTDLVGHGGVRKLFGA